MHFLQFAEFAIEDLAASQSTAADQSFWSEASANKTVESKPVLIDIIESRKRIAPAAEFPTLKKKMDSKCMQKLLNFHRAAGRNCSGELLSNCVH